MDMQEVFIVLRNFQTEIKRFEFIDIFGPSLGKHLWRKFKQYNYSVTMLEATLDTPARDKLHDYLEKHYIRYRYGDDR